MLKCFLQYYKPYKKILLLLIVGSLVRAGLELLFPYLVKQLLEQQIPLTNISLLWQWAVILLALYLASFGIHFWVDYKACHMSAAMERDMRRDLFWHVQQQSFSFFDRNKLGQLVSRLTGDLSEVGSLA
ncbi:MAG: ABC transporter transmembrane domain-containing protein, partial [Phascolarctobacterium sp.]